MTEAQKRILSHIEKAEVVIQSISPTAEGKIPLTLAPIGANKSGKSFFVNHMAMMGNLAELEGWKETIDQKQYWANKVPVVSSAGGSQAQTIFATHIRYREGSFKAILEISSEEVFQRRLTLRQSLFPETMDDQPDYHKARNELFAIVGECFGIQKLESNRKEIVLFEMPPGNLFDQLTEVRNKLQNFENKLRSRSLLTWVATLVFEGNFLSLKELNLELIDVS